VNVNIAANAAQDGAGNQSVAATQFSVTYQDDSGINDYLSSSIKVSPNPTNGIVNVKLNNSENRAITLTISNLSGKVIWTKQATATQINEQIDFSGTAKACYILTVTDGKGVYSEKIIVE